MPGQLVNSSVAKFRPTSVSLSLNLIANYPSIRTHQIETFLLGYRISEAVKCPFRILWMTDPRLKL